MMDTKKHYQGQKKAEGEYYNKRKLCPLCNAILKNVYIRETIPDTKKKTFTVVGLACPDCDHMERLNPENIGDSCKDQ